MDLENFRTTYLELEKMKLPAFSGDDRLDDWLEHLFEIDACIAGLACTVIGGGESVKKRYS